MQYIDKNTLTYISTYLDLAVKSFKDFSFFVFEYNKKCSCSILLEGNDIYFFIKTFSLYEFFEDLFVIDLPENAIRIVVYKFEGIIVKIEKSLAEKGFFEFVW